MMRPSLAPPARPWRGLRRRLVPAILAPAVLLAGSLASGAPKPPAASGAVELRVTTVKLGNGLTVLVHEDHTVPLVAVDVTYRVGSKDEVAGRTGFAHLFEHLMFQGSQHVGDDEHLRLVGEAGGSANGTTSEDRTNFFEEVPSNFLERALFLESDRMGYFVEALSQEKLDNQREVVKNERRQSYENRPYGMVPFLIHENIYPKGHPYHHLTIGAHEDLEAATLDDVKAFFNSWYVPGNATLAIVGDVTVERAVALAEKYFGQLPTHDTPPHAKADPVRLTEARRVESRDDVSLERVYLVWPTPSWFAPGDAELDLVASVLGGKTGRLYQRLVHELQIAQSVDVMQGSSALGSTFMIVGTARPGHTAAEIEKIVDEELAQLLGPKAITPEELSRSQRRWEAGFVYGLQPIGSMGGRAGRITEYALMLGDANGFERDRRRYVDATVDAVNRVARDELGRPRLTVTVLPKPKPAPPPPAVEAAKPDSKPEPAKAPGKPAAPAKKKGGAR